MGIYWLCTTMKRTIIILLLLLKAAICWSQIDSNYVFEEEKKIDFINFNNRKCQNNNIQLLRVNVTHCDSLNNKSILPSKFHRHYLKSRLISINREKDTLKIALIGFSDCCSHFFADLDCDIDTVLNLKYEDIDEVECFCGGCPYLFYFTILDRNKTISGILLNGNKIDLSNDIYSNAIEIKKHNFFTGKTIVKIYYERIDDFKLILEKHYSRRGNLILIKTFYLGIETHE